ncbi:DUF624 domain-containing protein [Aquibacillus koreensis]|uniref:DUF624 domain-containing protein n=1 Tax=Aquibacillus koreensis TaxID=279446 RepID=A0A9X3WMM5_9BACI|nr:DUF624 domain-containing protein [Aquibacillus koreensis]MCT2537210.1 DUF624 domain-containing protein [Aquibacillus koreensis]MDC3421558.1 DUF624 domain-containing protein [Aquibacillus koreensis]
MEKTDNIFFRVLDIFAHFVLLNVLWMIACIPIVTFFPATTAMFAVVRKWSTQGIEAGAVRPFIRSFKENFKKSFLLGIVGLFVTIILVLDYSIVLENEFTGRSVVLTLLLFATILFAFTSLYVFFILVNYELRLRDTLKNALFLSISYIFHTLLCFVIIFGMIIVIYFMPALFIIFGSVSSFVLYFIFQNITVRIQQSSKTLGKTSV